MQAGWMGWYCYHCDQPFEHARFLVDHLIAEHDEDAASVA